MSDQPKKKGGTWIKVVLGLLGLGLLVLAGALAYGTTLPETFVASRSVDVNQSATGVFDVLTNVPDYPSWANLKAVKDFRQNPDGTYTWVEVLAQAGEAKMQMVDIQRPMRVRINVVDHQLYKGYWLYELVDVEEGGRRFTRVTLTDYTTPGNPLFRVMFNAAGDRVGSYLEAHLADLKRKAESAKP